MGDPKRIPHCSRPLPAAPRSYPIAPGCAHGSALAQPSQTVEKLSMPCCKSVLLWKHFPFWRN
ncbi:hypothetical protein GT625_28905 [Burkholderia thailandensis]|nr:hypothetical protein [Burkholderia thailandensis]